MLIEIPADFLALKAADPALALRWRLSTRAAFETLFDQGFAVTDFISAANRVAYVLTQETIMIIDRVTLHHLRMPLLSPFVTSFGRTVDRECVLVAVYSEGLIGYGECATDHDPGYTYETSGTAWHILREFLVPPLLGQDVAGPAGFQARVAGVRGHPLAKAGVELALWDLLGKREGKSLRELLGGTRDRVAVGVSVGLQASPEVLVETVRGFLAQGYGRIKVKIKPGRDVADAQAVRRAFPDIRLQVDANSAYTLETAPVLRPLDDLNLLLIEQPLNEDDIWDHRRLQAEFHTPICLDESILSARHAWQALEMDACRVINIKPGRVGGLTEAVAIHDLCRPRGIPVWCGGMLETGVGRRATWRWPACPASPCPATFRRPTGITPRMSRKNGSS